MFNLKVCDSIMGSGKTKASIKRMNEDTDYNYIFVTPYLEEVKRILRECANRKFVEPINRGKGKLANLHSLLSENRNVCNTHALFKAYTPETMEFIRKGNYKLILDEVVDVVETINLTQSDMDKLFVSNTISVDEDGKVSWLDHDYIGKFSEIKLMIESDNVIYHNNKFLYWVFPIDVFSCFKEVIFLTYLFDAQIQKYYCDMKKIKFEYIYTNKNENGEYEFCDTCIRQDYERELINKIHILEDKKMNAVGDSKTSLSSSWFEREKKKKDKPLIKQLKNNLYNVLRHKYKGKSDDILWTTFIDAQESLSGKGFSDSFKPCNLRATNEYQDRIYLAYCLNVYFVPHLKNYFSDHNVEVKEEQYALSEMIQWIWRSAIRDNKEIYIYIPSRRMRELLQSWLSDLSI